MNILLFKSKPAPPAKPNIRKNRTVGAPDKSAIRNPKSAIEKCDCPDEHAWFGDASGTNKKRYRVRVCTKCGRMKMAHDDPKAYPELDDADPMAGFFKSCRPARVLPLRMMMKAVAKGCFRDPKSCGLRWVTAHPHGDEGDGVPLLVQDNGEEYTVVGGAGGSMNQTVFRKPQGSLKEKHVAARENKEKVRREKIANEPEWVQEQAKQATQMRQEAQEKRSALEDHIRGLFGDPTMAKPFVEVEDQIRKLARAKALEAKVDARPEEVKQFEDQAVKEAKGEQRDLLRKATNELLDAAARRALGEEVGEQIELATKSGKTVHLRLPPAALEDVAKKLYESASLINKAKAIEKALDTGDHETLAGLEARMTEREPTPKEIEDWAKKGYVERENVDAQTNLVLAAQSAPTANRRRNLASGVTDGINSFTGSITQEAILPAEESRALGPENSARVAAAYLRQKEGERGREGEGENAGKLAEGLRERLAKHSYAAAVGTLDTISDMDDIVKAARDAAGSGDGTMGKGQASIIAMNMATQKYRLANVCQGQLRAAAAMAHWLEADPESAEMHTSMSFAGGNTDIEAHARAKSYGLDEGDYSVEPAEGGGRNVIVQSDALTKMVAPHTIADHERNMQMEALRDDVAVNPGNWRPEGLSDKIVLQPQQELGARSIVQQKRMVLNMGAGSGKTSVYYAAAADLISSGKAERGIISMPAKPRSQQEDYTDPEGKQQTGEKSKFLTPEMGKQMAVVADSADLKRKLKDVADGSLKVLIVSPQLMREHVDELLKAGFGGKRTFYFADEAHELSAGLKDKGAQRNAKPEPAAEKPAEAGAGPADSGVKAGTTEEPAEGEARGSGMSQAFRKLMGSAEYAAAGSGTLLENDASELHDLLHAVVGSQSKEAEQAFSKQFGSAKQFNDKWQRIAHGGQNMFSEEAAGQLSAQLAGNMVSYHGQPTREGPDGKEAVLLHEGTKVVPASATDKTKVAAANRRYQLDKLSDDPDVRKAAALVRETSVKNALSLSDAKADAIIEDIKKARAADPDHHVIIHSSTLEPLRRMRKRLEAEGIKTVRVTGAEDDKQVADNMKRFNKGDANAVLLSDAGNYGINAQRGDFVAMMATPATPSKYTQLMKRAHRIGREKDVTARIYMTDMPQEMIAYHRMKTIKGKQMDLLTRIAGDGGALDTIAEHHKEIEDAAARGNG